MYQFSSKLEAPLAIAIRSCLRARSQLHEAGGGVLGGEGGDEGVQQVPVQHVLHAMLRVPHSVVRHPALHLAEHRSYPRSNPSGRIAYSVQLSFKEQNPITWHEHGQICNNYVAAACHPEKERQVLLIG